MDTGESDHMPFNKEWLRNYVKNNKIFVKRGKEVVFSKAECEIYDSNDYGLFTSHVTVSMEERGFYKLNIRHTTVPSAALAADVHKDESLE